MYSALIKRSGQFDAGWYLENNPDVAKSGMDPVSHYLRFGAAEGRNPNPLFDSLWYLKRYPDVAASGTNPFLHYLRHGQREGRASYDINKLINNANVAVVAHICHIELWEELKAYLRNIPVKYDLYVTAPEELSGEIDEMVLCTHPFARIRRCPNIGCDIAPFMALLPDLVKRKYTAVCKIHTKMGVVEPATWRRILLEGVLGSSELVKTILVSFVTRNDLYFVGSKDVFLSYRAQIRENENAIQRISDALYPGRPLPRDWGFFEGSVFWASHDALLKWSRISADPVFKTESGITDRQVAHAVEQVMLLPAAIDARLVGLVSENPKQVGHFSIELNAAPGSPSTQDFATLLRQRKKEHASTKGGLYIGGGSRFSKKIVAGNEGLGVNLIGPVTALNGLGVSSRGYMQALLSADIKLNVVRWRSGFERVREIPLETPTRPLQPINIVHLNMDYLSQGILSSTPLKEILSKERYNIAIFYWELIAVPAYWHDVVKAFDEIWCASDFVRKSISAITDRPVRLLRPSLAQNERSGTAGRRNFGIPEKRFVFFYSADFGSVVGRKNPKAFLDAYIAEFTPEENACCVIKINYSNSGDSVIQEIKSITASRPDVVLMEMLISDEELTDLYGSIDCYVSPHRSEGLGLTVIEAMMMGKPVIATPYGGVADFVNPATAYPLGYKLTEVPDGCWPYPEGYIWADPSISSIRETMRRVFMHPDEAAKRGVAGQICVKEMFSTEKASREIRQALEDIWTNCQMPPPNTSADTRAL